MHTHTNSAPSFIDINLLAQEIRRVDGKHSLGAAALAEALTPFLNRQYEAILLGQNDSAFMTDHLQKESHRPSKRLEPVDVVRDENGFWQHPDAPDFVDDDSGLEYKQWFETLGLEGRLSWLEHEDDNHPVKKGYFEQGIVGCLGWEPPQPEGQGWFLLCIGESDGDGPAAWWVRYPV